MLKKGRAIKVKRLLMHHLKINNIYVQKRNEITDDKSVQPGALKEAFEKKKYFIILVPVFFEIIFFEILHTKKTVLPHKKNAFLKTNL